MLENFLAEVVEVVEAGILHADNRNAGICPPDHRYVILVRNQHDEGPIPNDIVLFAADQTLQCGRIKAGSDAVVHHGVLGADPGAPEGGFHFVCRGREVPHSGMSSLCDLPQHRSW